MLQKASEAWRDGSVGKDLQLLHERGVRSCMSVSLVLGRWERWVDPSLLLAS